MFKPMTKKGKHTATTDFALICIFGYQVLSAILQCSYTNLSITSCIQLHYVYMAIKQHKSDYKYIYIYTPFIWWESAKMLVNFLQHLMKHNRLDIHQH